MEPTKIVLLAIYVPVFLIGFIGNLCVLFALHRRKDLRSPVNIFFGNMAISDFLCIILSLFHVQEYVNDRWSLGDAVCSIQGTLFEVMYTVSILTLICVAIERYLSVCHHEFTYTKTNSKCIKISALIWMVAVLLCSPLFYGWTAKVDESGHMRCNSNRWSDKQRMIFYGVHTFVVYVIPLVSMIITHYKIFEFLIRKVRFSVDITRQFDLKDSKKVRNDHHILEIKCRASVIHVQRLRNRKVMNILVVITLVFLLLWTPFIILRLMRFSGLNVPGIAWKVSQGLMIIAAAVNYFIYAFMSPDLRKVFITFIPFKTFRKSMPPVPLSSMHANTI